ncbi:hypothetical protein ACFQ4J_06660 [Laceyella tengchongensis]|jgi:hypothetical protein
MRFEMNLIHRCTLVRPGQKTGIDSYGRPIYEEMLKPDVPCRVDQFQHEVARDEFGLEYAVESVLFLSPFHILNESMKVRDIKDQEGRIILPGLFLCHKIMPVFDRKGLHHYEVLLVKEGGQDG